MRHLYRSLLSISLFGALALPSFAEAQSADQIMQKALNIDPFGWDEAETRVRMVLKDRKGKKKERLMENLRRRKDNQLQSVVRFRRPQEVAGTAFLMLERNKGESEQYIYLPRLKRTRRLVGREREGSFMGSDFSYADFERRDARDSSHRRLPDENMGNKAVYVIESTPTKKSGSSYSKITTWIDQKTYLPLRIRFTDKKGKLLKTFYTRRVRNENGKPVIVECKMENKQSGHSTVFVLEDMKPRHDIPDTMFTPTALEHG